MQIYDFIMKEECWKEYLAHMDGFSLELEVDPGCRANSVYVLPDVELECYEDPQLAHNSSTKKAKAYFMLITLPGEGAAACVAMESGSRNLGTNREDQGFKFWYEEAEEKYGIHIPPEVMEELKGKQWRVQLLT